MSVEEGERLIREFKDLGGLVTKLGKGNPDRSKERMLRLGSLLGAASETSRQPSRCTIRDRRGNRASTATFHRASSIMLLHARHAMLKRLSEMPAWACTNLETRTAISCNTSGGRSIRAAEATAKRGLRRGMDVLVLVDNPKYM